MSNFKPSVLKFLGFFMFFFVSFLTETNSQENPKSAIKKNKLQNEDFLIGFYEKLKLESIPSENLRILLTWHESCCVQKRREVVVENRRASIATGHRKTKCLRSLGQLGSSSAEASAAASSPGFTRAKYAFPSWR